MFVTLMFDIELIRRFKGLWLKWVLVLVKSNSLYLDALYRIGMDLSNMFVRLHEPKREWVVQLNVICMSTSFLPYFLLVSPIISVYIYIYIYVSIGILNIVVGVEVNQDPCGNVIFLDSWY